MVTERFSHLAGSLDQDDRSPVQMEIIQRTLFSLRTKAQA
jgi:hypothetical protein